MSVQAMSRVWSESMSGGSERLVMLAIANYACAAGTGAWPSVATLAVDCRISVRSVQRIIRRLEEIGELRVHRSAGPGGAHLYDVLPASSVTPDRGRHSVTPPDTLTPVNLSGGVTQLCHQGGDTAVSPNPLSIRHIPQHHHQGAHARDDEGELSDIEQAAVACVQAVPGAEDVPAAEIASHLRDVLAVCEAAPLPDEQLRFELLKFRDHWVESRAGARTARWTGWRKALTNWVSRIPREPSASTAGPVRPRATSPARSRASPDYSGIAAVADAIRAREKDQGR